MAICANAFVLTQFCAYAPSPRQNHHSLHVVTENGKTTNPIQTQPDWTKHRQTEPKCVTCENSHKSFFLSLHTVHIHVSFSQIKRNYVIWLMFKTYKVIYKLLSCLTVLLFISGSSRFKKKKCCISSNVSFWQETSILVCKHIHIYMYT